jgi:hypothetical protein
MRFTKALAVVGALAALVMAARPADAHWDRWGGGPGYYYAPPPVYHAPPRVYAPPPAPFYGPPPGAYYAPPPPRAFYAPPVAPGFSVGLSFR